jgi:ABC-type phosphate transport system substrate-binding protein
MKEGSSTRTEFVTGILKKSEQQYKAYWAKLLFTGKGNPPKELESSADVKAEVAANKNAIGIIDVADVDDSVKVVYQLP